MDGIIKIFKSLEESSLLIKFVDETVENEVKEQKGEFLSMLVSILSSSLWGNFPSGREMKSKIPEYKATIPGLEIIQSG